MEPVVKVTNLHRSFGDLAAVSGLNFEIGRGEVLGFIGANGAGKTTTMRILATLDQPTWGAVSICGIDTVHYPAEVRKLIGWMPDAYGRIANLTVAEYLDFYCRAYGFRNNERIERVRQVMEFTELFPLQSKDIETLSKGMAQRLCLARMLLHDPQILILDEPAAGLDPKARVEFKHLVRLLAQDKKTLFISSHILSELEDMCDSILFINRGTIAHHGTTAALKANATGATPVTIRIAGDPAPLLSWIPLQPGVTLVEALKDGCTVAFESGDPELLSATLRRLINDGFQVIDFHRRERKLEEAFIDMLEKLDEPNGGES